MSAYENYPATTIFLGDAVHGLSAQFRDGGLDGGVDCCVTSPPYYGLRDYGVDGQIGLEETPDEYVAKLVRVFREVRRVLRDDGTLWLNIGDSYAGKGGGGQGAAGAMATRAVSSSRSNLVRSKGGEGIKNKDLMGIPWMLAFALRADGWWLRDAIVWHKPNPMPASVRDRCTNAYEHVFLLSKRPAYFFDADAIAERAAQAGRVRSDKFGGNKYEGICHGEAGVFRGSDERNARNVWTLPTQPCHAAHFATMPPRLAERCILAGSRPGGVVLDPFMGAGTTGLVAARLGRIAAGCELNAGYAEIARQRIEADGHSVAVVKDGEVIARPKADMEMAKLAAD